MNATETFNFVNNVWPDHCPSLRHVRRLCKEFKEATRENFEFKTWPRETTKRDDEKQFDNCLLYTSPSPRD